MKKLSTTALLAAVLALAACGGGSGSSSSSSESAAAGSSAAGPAGSSGAAAASGVKVTITFWHGQTDIAGTVIEKLVAEYEASHPNVTIKAELGSDGDEMLQKLQPVLQGDGYPDIAYVYGSDAANVAQSPKVVDLSADIKANGFAWDDLYAAGRETATVDGKIIGFPSVIDDLAVVYNTKLLAAAGAEAPAAGWTWDDYRALALKLTDASKGQYGAAWPIAGTEDTVWRFWPLLWQQGGDVLSADNTKSTFASAEGVKALTLISDMALKDKSLYADPSPDSNKMYGLFNAGKLGMVITGPWQLPDINDNKIEYGVVPLPAFAGDPQTISGPDDWVVFDHGDARRRAAVDFLAWLHEPEHDLAWSIGSGNLPVNEATTKLPGFADFTKTYAGMDVFDANLANAKHIRPQVTQYTALSTAVGKAIAATLLGRSAPDAALADAAKTTDALLAGS